MDTQLPDKPVLIGDTDTQVQENPVLISDIAADPFIFGSSTVDNYPRDVREILVKKLRTSAISNRRLYGWVKSTYEGTLTIPSAEAFSGWCSRARKRMAAQASEASADQLLSQFSAGLAEIETIVAQVRMGSHPDFNKVRLLEGLVGKCLMRITDLEDEYNIYKASLSKKRAALFGKRTGIIDHTTVNDMIADPRGKRKDVAADPAGSQKIERANVDVAIARYITEVRSIISDVLKMSAQFKADEVAAREHIRDEARVLLDLVKTVVMEVCPERYARFADRLTARLRSQSWAPGSPNRDAVTVEETETNGEEQATATESPS